MLKYLLVLITFSFILFGCGDKNNEPEKTLTDAEKYSYDSTDLKTDGLDTSGKPFLMEYKFKKGDKIVYRLTTISNNTQKVTMDTTISNVVNQKIIYLLDIDIKEVDEDGAAEAEIKINSLKLEASANGETFNFEAGKNADSTKIQQFAEFQALHNNPFSVRFSKRGEILEVFKADKISNKYLEIKGAADTISANDRNLIRQDLINGVLTPLLTQIIRKVSDKEMYTDSTWQIQQAPIPLMVYQINYTNTYKVESVEKFDDNRVAVINAGIDFKYTGQSKVNQGNVMYNFEKPLSTAEGKIYFDVDKGMQIKSRTKTRLEISYSMEANTPQGKQKGTRRDVISNTNILELL